MPKVTQNGLNIRFFKYYQKSMHELIFYMKLQSHKTLKLAYYKGFLGRKTSKFLSLKGPKGAHNDVFQVLFSFLKFSDILHKDWILRKSILANFQLWRFVAERPKIDQGGASYILWEMKTWHASNFLHEV